MSIYKTFAETGAKWFPKHKLLKLGFNFSPMYRRSTGRVIHVSEDLLNIRIKLPLSYKNRNYVNSIFGGSMFAAVDPIPMVQLINLIGDAYVVWDKSAEIFFKRPAKETLYADFNYTLKELDEIKTNADQKNEIEIIKTTLLMNADQSKVFCEVRKKIYVANKAFYKEKRRKKKA